MLLSRLVFVIGCLSSTASLASSINPGQLPMLPAANDLTHEQIGEHYRWDPESEEKVLYMGLLQDGEHFAISLDDTPMNRMTYADTANHCASKGDGWRMPVVDELRMIRPFVDDPEIDFLPGSYWSTTPAPCRDCGRPQDFKMAYDVRTGNFQNVYTIPIFKQYPLCVLTIR